MSISNKPWPSPAAPWQGRRRLLLVGWWLVMLLGYRAAATQLATSPLYARDNVCFRADTKRALGDLVGTRLQDHHHTTGHPLFVLWHQPLGSAVRALYWICEDRIKPAEAKRRAAPWLTAAAGASAVLLMFFLLQHWLATRRSLLFALVYGASCSTVFYASVPETYIFSGLGLTALAWAAVRRGRAETWVWVMAVVYAASNLTINVIPAALWSWVRFRRNGGWRRAAIALLASGGLLVALSLLQRLIYPETSLFFMPSSVGREAGWLSWEILSSPWATLRVLAQHFWSSNVIAPEPVRLEVLGLPMASVEAGSWATLRPSAPLLALWGMVLAAGIAGLCQRRAWMAPLVTAVVGLGFFFAFFSIFGHDRMLYSALWTPLTVLVVAVGNESFLSGHPRWARVWEGLLLVLVLGMAWHHWHFLGKLAALVPA